MSIVVAFFVIGIVLVALEIVVPGAVLGIVGGIALLVAVITSFVQFGLTGGSVATTIALIIGGITLYLEFYYLPRSRLAKVFSMSETVDGRSQPEIARAEDVVGREVVALTTLAPTGYVELDGRRYEAATQSGLVPAGIKLRVVAVETFRLIVNPIKSSQ